MDKFNRLLKELGSTGAKIEEDTGILLLVSLQLLYGQFQTTLMYGKDTLELDEVVAIVLLSMSQSRRSVSQLHHLIVKPGDE